MEEQARYNSYHNIYELNVLANCDLSVYNAVIPSSKYLFGLGSFDDYSDSDEDDVYYNNITRLQDDIEYLVLSSQHKRKISRFPQGLKFLNILFNYSHVLDNLPSGLVHLVLSVGFNAGDILNYLPAGLQYLVIQSNSNRFEVDLDNLPFGLQYLSLGSINNCYSSLDFLPTGLKCLVMPQYYRGDLWNLPPNLEILDLYGGYEGRIDELPDTVNKIIISAQRGYDIADEYVHLVVAL